MTTTEPTTPATPLAEKKVQARPKDTPNVNALADKTRPDVVTLEALALEMKVSPRDARMMLRLAAKQTKAYPNLGKDHVARQPWQWATGSKALDEARKALSASQDS